MINIFLILNLISCFSNNQKSVSLSAKKKRLIMKQIKKQQREENAMEGKEKKGKNELTKKTYIIIRSLNCLLKFYHVSFKKEKVLIIV